MLIAAHISRAGVCAEMLEDVLLHHELVISEFILEELARKLVEKFNYPKRDVDQVGAFFVELALLCSLPICRRIFVEISTDLPVLGTAVAGDCALLISVDRDLLDMGAIQGIPIIRPGEYWRRMDQVK